MLEVSLRKRLGAFALDATFASGPGVTALFGRSGAGKTSIVRMIAGLSRPDAGRIAVNGRILFDSSLAIDEPARRRQVGIVFQEPLLFPHMSVRRNLLYGAGGSGAAVGGETALAQVSDLLGIGALLERRPASLSGGEAQRVAIGRALLSAPDVLLMDEPLAHLDGARRAAILPWLDRLSREANLPILYVSHSVEEVARLADQLVVIDEGTVVAAGPVGDVFGRVDLGPVTGRYEAGAVLDARLAGQDTDYALTRLTVAGQNIVLPAIGGAPGDHVRLHIRARDVGLATSRPQDTSFRNILAGVVDQVMPEEGTFAEVRIDIGGQWLRARVTRQAADALELAPGTDVFCLVKSVAIGRSSVRAT